MTPCERKVLVIEDDADVRDAIVEVLEDQRYGWIAATNGAEALDVLRDDPEPCVILLDLMMPIMDGWQFRRAQLGDPRLAQVPVVVLSAHADVNEAATQLGAAGHLRKPIELGRLMKVVEEHCEPTAA